jgi:hypothetical protein
LEAALVLSLQQLLPRKVAPRCSWPRSFGDTSTRNKSLRELILARALYRCGDHEGLAEKILNTYANDLRGHHATHAKAVLRKSDQ